MSNKKVDELAKKFDGEYRKIRIADGITYVVIKVDEFVGVGYARCSEKDEFDPQVGINIATRRALKHIAKQIDDLS